MNVNIKRRAKLIHELIVNIINNVIKNEQIGYINITDVELTNDLSFSTVYYTILDNSEKNLSLVSELIEKNKKKIRLKFANQIRNMKKIPYLIFKYDHSLEYGHKIDQILNDIKK
ncbi:ribosome-binding factor A [Candidatus Phytoplasma oryzae]|uniref:Ribosome-binding factor A n=1 Tax=Candidatus Phytoplasma oryzae TaxID=203274 RepID=A0A139JRF9_9MOLU|nr:30S ribosome-binding factor RbfA [Candidatus Phytoplasma oryzae]KXT29424.1 ribosome-binding factor A [Candidatus Phytoplasma oryzae]RAM58005.1 ribosome-binding factor A [Candidatus Phytoplasma oryzae]